MHSEVFPEGLLQEINPLSMERWQSSSEPFFFLSWSPFIQIMVMILQEEEKGRGVGMRKGRPQ